MNTKSLFFASISVVAFGGAFSCTSSPPPPTVAPAPAPVAPKAMVVPPDPVIVPNPNFFYRLVQYGFDSVVSIPGQMPNEIRGAWMTFRGNYWIAVDTLAVDLDAYIEGPRLFGRRGWAVRVDSGLSQGGAGDTSIFISKLAPRLLPMAGAIGHERHDTLVIRPPVPPSLARGPWSEFRVYVRVRP